jgi:hypothetical protein
MRGQACYRPSTTRATRGPFAAAFDALAKTAQVQRAPLPPLIFQPSPDYPRPFGF